MKFKLDDDVVPVSMALDKPLPNRVHKIFDIEKCPDHDEICPKNCPGLISLDTKDFKCYAYEINGKWQMGIKLN